MTDESRFLDAIKAASGDLSLRLVYADWLEEKSDARCEYVRLNGKLQELAATVPPSHWSRNALVRQIRSRLKELAGTFDAEWVAIFAALEPLFVTCRSCRKVIPAREAIATHPRTGRKMKGSRYCQLCYEDSIRAQMRGFVRSLGTERRKGPSYDD